jgi:hypothetical protein
MFDLRPPGSCVPTSPRGCGSRVGKMHTDRYFRCTRDLEDEDASGPLVV